MCRLSSLNMTPEETPDLHFLADSRSLRQAITSFGCISAQVMCTQHTSLPAGIVYRHNSIGEAFTELSVCSLLRVCPLQTPLTRQARCRVVLLLRTNR